MKKLLSVVVVFVMLLAMSVSVFAADPTTTYQDGSWTTAGSNEAYANSMMTIIAVTENQQISVDSIQYIDQITADESGAYSFTSYLPKTNPAKGTRYEVKVGGQNIDTPLAAGYIESQETDVTIAGKVNYTGTNTGATVTLTPSEGDAITATTTPATGEFTMEAPDGTYELRITKPGHTKHIEASVDAATLSETADLTYTIHAGDADGNDVVGVMDIVEVVGALGADIAENKSKDIDDNGVVGVMDITEIVAKLGKTSVGVTPAA